MDTRNLTILSLCFLVTIVGKVIPFFPLIAPYFICVLAHACMLTVRNLKLRERTGFIMGNDVS